MDSKIFLQQLSKKLNLSQSETTRRLETLAVAIGELCRDGKSVSIPSFGTFSPEMHKEEIRLDHSTGRRLLCPPEISVEFKASSSLSKSVAK